MREPALIRMQRIVILDVKVAECVILEYDRGRTWTRVGNTLMTQSPCPAGSSRAGLLTPDEECFAQDVDASLGRVQVCDLVALIGSGQDSMHNRVKCAFLLSTNVVIQEHML